MIFQKRSGPLSFLPFVCEIELSLQSRAPFSDLIFQKCSDRDSFLQFLCEIELLRQSCAHFVDLILQKCCDLDNFLTFSDRAAKPRKQRPLVRRPRMAILLEKTRGFAPESLFKTEFTRSGSLTLPNYVMIL